MKLSESLRRGIMETGVGGIVNKFKVKRRRDVLFFEEILANYIKECEKAGYEEEIFEIGKKWSELSTYVLLPDILKKIPLTIFFNKISKKVWVNLGLMDDLHVTRKKERIVVSSKNEYFTRFIGENEFNKGLLVGSITVLDGHEVDCIEKKQTENKTQYICILKKESWNPIKAKEKSFYDNQNLPLKITGPNLNKALEKNILVLRGNRLYFRNRSVIPIENTIFHLFSNRGILLDRISEISFDFFKNIVKNDSSDEKKLLMLKNILQILGWGIIKISVKKKFIIFSIKSPPCGLQIEKENWTFLIKVIHGYLWLLHKETKVNEVEYKNKTLRISYSF